MNLGIMRQPRIARRLLVWFLVLALLPMIILGTLVYFRSRDVLIKAEKEKVLAVADHSVNRLERWSRERRRSVTNLSQLAASEGVIRSFERASESVPDSAAESVACSKRE